MVSTPEIAPPPKAPEGVVERPTEIPAEIERVPGVVKSQAQYQPPTQADDQTQVPVQTPAPKKIAINVPADEESLTKWSKGPAENSVTWYAVFWLRLMKKALHFGWKTVTKPVQAISS